MGHKASNIAERIRLRIAVIYKQNLSHLAINGSDDTAIELAVILIFHDTGQANLRLSLHQLVSEKRRVKFIQIVELRLEIKTLFKLIRRSIYNKYINTEVTW